MQSFQLIAKNHTPNKEFIAKDCDTEMVLITWTRDNMIIYIYITFHIGVEDNNSYSI